MRFAKEVEEEEESSSEVKWKMLVVDDEIGVHKTTKSVLKKFIFENKELEIISAYNGQEAIDILKKHSDIAVVLLDVVMETDDAGLVVAKKIREEIKNNLVRIVLRTGQPGTAPEKEVILNYDINDYKEKTELTSLKLFTTVVASLRSYKDMAIIEQNRIGLEKIIVASRNIFKLDSMILFVEGVLTQLVSLLNLNENPTNFSHSDAFFSALDNNKIVLLANSGKFKDDEYNIISPKALRLMEESYLSKEAIEKDGSYVGIFKSKNNKYIFLYLEYYGKLNERNKNFLEIFLSNVSIAFENLCLNDEIIDTQKEMIERLGELGESRSKETANHVKRVAKISEILARASKLSEDEVKYLSMASPMHDIGKIAIPDDILLKKGKLSHDEFEVMKEHAKIGWEILKVSKREILKVASIVAHEHHEHWDGKGYPRALKGNDIHIYGRITAVADVYDALTQERVYKPAWPREEVFKYLKERKGKQFDPSLIDLFFENFDIIDKAIIKINNEK